MTSLAVNVPALSSLDPRACASTTAHRARSDRIPKRKASPASKTTRNRSAPLSTLSTPAFLNRSELPAEPAQATVHGPHTERALREESSDASRVRTTCAYSSAHQWFATRCLDAPRRSPRLSRRSQTLPNRGSKLPFQCSKRSATSRQSTAPRRAVARYDRSEERRVG